MESGRPGGEPTRNARRDMLMFLGFVALLLTIVAVVLIVRNDWPETRWVALQAVAATVQAVGVLVALVFAWAQIRSAREEARRHRRDELIDRLQAVIHEDLLPAWNTVSVQWRVTVDLIEWAAEARVNEEFDAWLAEDYERDKNELRSALTAVSKAVSRTYRVLQLLGSKVPMALHKIDVARLLLPVHDLPRRVGDPVSPDVVENHEGITQGDEAATVIRHWLDGYIKEHVESPRRPARSA